MKPNEDVIQAAKDLLTMAESGEIQGLALIAIEDNNEVGQRVAGTIKDDKFKAIAAVEVLKRDLMDGVDRLKDHYPKEFKETIRGKAASGKT